MKPGDTLETSMWMNGLETAEQRLQFEADVLEQMTESARIAGLAITPLRWYEKAPGTDRVPPVPPHIDGPTIRLLVAEADLVIPNSGNFLAELDPKDLRLLRNITRRAYALQYPGESRLTNRQCDTLINDMGPDVAVAALEKGQATIQ